MLLCNTIEEGEEKYYQYWPLQIGETTEFGRLKVTLQSESESIAYVMVRRLHVCNETVQCVHVYIFIIATLRLLFHISHCGSQLVALFSMRSVDKCLWQLCDMTY